MLGPDGSEASKSKSWQRRHEAFLAIRSMIPAIRFRTLAITGDESGTRNLCDSWALLPRLLSALRRTKKRCSRNGTPRHLYRNR